MKVWHPQSEFIFTRFVWQSDISQSFRFIPPDIDASKVEKRDKLFELCYKGVLNLPYIDAVKRLIDHTFNNLYRAVVLVNFKPGAAVQTVLVDMWYVSGGNVLRWLVIIAFISIILIVSMQLFTWYLFLWSLWRSELGQFLAGGPEWTCHSPTIYQQQDPWAYSFLDKPCRHTLHHLCVHHPHHRVQSSFFSLHIFFDWSGP